MQDFYENDFVNIFGFFLDSINGDEAAQPVPSSKEQNQEESAEDETDEPSRVSWPAPFEMPSSLSEDASASNQVNIVSFLS